MIVYQFIDIQIVRHTAPEDEEDHDGDFRHRYAVLSSVYSDAEESDP
jgi:hypothetical protein